MYDATVDDDEFAFMSQMLEQMHIPTPDWSRDD